MLSRRFSKRSSKTLLGFLLGLAVLGLLVGTILLKDNPSTTVTLETYSHDKFSIQVPGEYPARVESGEDSPNEISVSFREKDNKASQSQIQVFVEDSSEVTSKEERKQALLFMETIFKGLLEIDGGSGKLENSKSKNITFKNNPARVLTANIKDGGKTAGKAKLIVGISDSAAFAVSIVAYDSDKAFTESLDKIIDSLEVK